MTDSEKRLAEAINDAESICVFTGAGVSCPSGIPDFRSSGGLYKSGAYAGYMPEEIISHDFFFRHTELFYRFYREKMLFPDALPNDAHLFFSRLGDHKKTSVVTQNIDGLHQAAGSREVYELHGSVHRNFCVSCGRSYSLGHTIQDGIPRCEKDGALIKPDVVLYGEGLSDTTVSGAVKAISEADLLIIAGTSLSVYPAASFIGYFRGKTSALLNLSSTPYDSRADIIINGDVAETARHLAALTQI